MDNLLLQEKENKLRLLEADLSLVSSYSLNSCDFIDTSDVDKECQNIGYEILKNSPDILNKVKNNQINQKLNVYITAVVYSAGGHTREIDDWISNIYPDQENIIILTDKTSLSDIKQLHKFKEQNITVLANDLDNKVDQIKWLQLKLAELRPGRIFVSTTRTDVISLAALQEELVNELYWNVSLDHNVSIGLHLKSITKILVKRPYLYFYLKDKLNFKNLAYIPFNRPDLVAVKQSENNLDRIITASCTSSSSKIESKYKYKFVEIIPQILKITNGSHIHIGQISKDGLIEIYDNLKKLGLNKDQFIIIPHTESLADTLVKEKVDILFQTFPIPGGLVTIEAMEAGVMIINHKCYSSYLYNVSDFCYEEAFVWSEPEELFDYFKKLNKEEIRNQSKASRKFYERNNNSAIFKDIMNSDDITGIEIDKKKELINKMYDYPLNYYRRQADYKDLLFTSFAKKESFLRRKIRKIKKSFKKRLYKI